MAEIHNFADNKALDIMEKELLDVRDALRSCDGYDPTESLAENVRFLIKVARAQADLHRELRLKHNQLKKERENDKEVARSYPVMCDGRFGSGVFVADPQTTAWYGDPNRSGIATAHNHAEKPVITILDPDPCKNPGRFDPTLFLGSTDGYNR